MKHLILAILVALVAAAGCSKERREPVVQNAAISNPAPDFTLPGPSGDVQLSALKGNLVLVHFWATWCPPCREELPSLARLNGMMAGKQFRLLAVSIDTGGSEAVQKLFGQLGISLPVLLDPAGGVAKRYGITGVPETFVVSPSGTIIKRIIGPLEWTAPDTLAFLNDAMKTGN